MNSPTLEQKLAALSTLRDVTAAELLAQPDDQSLKAKLQDLMAQIEQVKSAITLHEAAERGALEARRNRDRLERQALSLNARQRALGIANKRISVATDIDATITKLGNLLATYKTMSDDCNDAAGNVCVVAGGNLDKRMDRMMSVGAHARANLAASITQAMLDIGLPVAMSPSGQIHSSLIVRQASIADNAKANAEALEVELNDLVTLL